MDTNLQHHGIKGQKWGVRRYQNKDGSLTPAGKRRYHPEDKRNKSLKDDIVEALNHPAVKTTLAYQNYIQAVDEYVDSYSKTSYGKIKANKRYVEQGAAFVKTYATKRYIDLMKEYE